LRIHFLRTLSAQRLERSLSRRRRLVIATLSGSVLDTGKTVTIPQQRSFQNKATLEKPITLVL